MRGLDILHPSCFTHRVALELSEMQFSVIYPDAIQKGSKLIYSHSQKVMVLNWIRFWLRVKFCISPWQLQDAQNATAEKQSSERNARLADDRLKRLAAEQRHIQSSIQVLLSFSKSNTLLLHLLLGFFTILTFDKEQASAKVAAWNDIGNADCEIQGGQGWMIQGLQLLIG